jgi:hypothetical protein
MRLGNSANSNSWNTLYLGIQNVVSYSLLAGGSFDVIKAGLGLASLIYGKQEINGTF